MGEVSMLLATKGKLNDRKRVVQGIFVKETQASHFLYPMAAMVMYGLV